MSLHAPDVLLPSQPSRGGSAAQNLNRPSREIRQSTRLPSGSSILKSGMARTATSWCSAGRWLVAATCSSLSGAPAGSPATSTRSSRNRSASAARSRQTRAWSRVRANSLAVERARRSRGPLAVESERAFAGALRRSRGTSHDGRTIEPGPSARRPARRPPARSRPSTSHAGVYSPALREATASDGFTRPTGPKSSSSHRMTVRWSIAFQLDRGERLAGEHDLAEHYGVPRYAGYPGSTCRGRGSRFARREALADRRRSSRGFDSPRRVRCARASRRARAAGARAQ